MKYDVAIIGSGLGGLQCAYILAKKGLNVCVLEKEARLGGCLQTYQRAGHELDTGFHYVGGLSEGQPLHRIFNYFGLLDLPWHQLDSDAFDEVNIGGQSYFFANGYEQFAQRMAEYFPKEKTNIVRYTDFLRQVGDNIVHSFDPRAAEDVYGQSLFAKSAYEYLCQTITDPLLRQVLSGTSLKLELNAETLPLYIFAQINSSYVQSAWRLRGGGQQLIDTLANHIRSMGGTIIAKAEAMRFVENGQELTAVELKNGEQIEAKHFISDVHPAATMRLLENSQLVRRIYRSRMASIPNTFGMFTASCMLRKDTVPYRNRNQYVYSTNDLWKIGTDAQNNTVQGVLASYQVPDDNNAYVRNIDLLTPMSWAEVEKWKETPVMQRGAEYNNFKESKTAACINMVSQLIPELQDNIEKVYTSTPLTYAHYTGTEQGAAYGIRKDFNDPMRTLLTPRTTVPNLLLTGQNLNLHGILGVSMTSFFTCSALVGAVNPFTETNNL